VEQSRIWVKLDVNWAADLGAEAVCAGVSPKSCIDTCTRSDRMRRGRLSLQFAGSPSSPSPLHRFLHYMGLGAWPEGDTDGGV
jgi:hypothetical protein